MMKRNQWTAALLALCLFACGVVAGVLGHRYYSETSVSAQTSPSDFRQQYLAEMKSHVHLTTDQLEQLQTILDDTKAKAKAVRDRMHPEMVRIKQEQLTRVKSILTPEQVPEYERLVADRERRFHAQEERDRQNDRRHGRPGPPHGP